MAKYRKKPVVVEAVQWTGANLLDCGDFLGGKAERNIRWSYMKAGEKLVISTLEGLVTASPGDFIIKGVAGEFYPCKPEIFAATYEPAD